MAENGNIEASICYDKAIEADPNMQHQTLTKVLLTN